MLFDIHFKIVLFGGSEFVEMPKIDMFQLISPRAVLLNSLFRATRGERKVIVMQINGQKKRKKTRILRCLKRKIKDYSQSK